MKRETPALAVRAPQSSSTSRTGEQAPSAEAARLASRRNRRESVESFVVVLIGFLIWSFEAEGFVIPTGSMAPTLMGRHKEITCPECGFVYQVNADCEAESSGMGAKTGLRVTWGTCENCRFTAKVDGEPSFAGDRIYTVKAGTELPFLPAAGKVEPKRWDVTVFKLPEDPAEVRYIKRLVGMPGEVLRIHQGDLWRRDLAENAPRERLNRPPIQQLQVQVPVYDDAHRATSLRDDPRWRRWAPSVTDSWSEPTPGTFAAGRSEGWRELRYRHIVPDPEQWEAIRAGHDLLTPPRASLVTDFSSFNTDLTPQSLQHPRPASRAWFQPHWVGDLTLSLTIDVVEASGRLRIELIEAGTPNHCEIDLASGEARLFHGDEPLGEPAATPIKAKGAYQVVFANVDDRLTLWVDGKLPFGDGRAYQSTDGETFLRPTVDDLEPARIGVQNAELAVSGLVLKRDLYYTQNPGEPDADDLLLYYGGNPRVFFDLLADPGRYADLNWRAPREFAIEAGRYMMLGDNSPWSRDSRAWGRADQTTPNDPERGWDGSGRESWEVPRALITGRAFSVYWPHFQPVWPKFRLGPDLRLPARPNLEEVRWIH
ncbi:S26 family signal peptidase [Paludisphaera borealis]|nr:S26 family signal peptidase [Paludisphaera borealis]